MAQVTINGSQLGNSLQTLLMSSDILPGDQPSYQLCKTIFIAHPLGGKMAEAPIALAQSQSREIAIPDSPEDQIRDAFVDEWKSMAVDRHIFNCARTARIYGISSIAILAEGVDPIKPIDYDKLYEMRIGFNILDPLNTAGSLVLNQDPNSIDFQKVVGIRIAGTEYHRSRSVTVMNEDPLYIEYTTSSFGFVGRSVYQRALYPLKSFVQSMITDDMVTRKAGLIIAMMKQAGSIIDNVMQKVWGQKRNLLREAGTNNVLSMDLDEKVETLNMQNLDGAFGMARTDILKNIATAADMPAVLLENETLTEGFGEGTEDAKAIARYIDRVRIWLAPLYDFFDPIVMHRAWNPNFYKTIQKQFPDEYGAKDYTTAFYEWKNSFTALWPNLLQEPESEQVKVEDVKLKAVIAAFEVLGPALDPDNKATMIGWVADAINENKLMFPDPLIFDLDALREFVPPQDQALLEPKAPKPFAATDSARRLDEAIARLHDPHAKARQLESLAKAIAALPPTDRKLLTQSFDA